LDFFAFEEEEAVFFFEAVAIFFLAIVDFATNLLMISSIRDLFKIKLFESSQL
jgi:hypothetical protein